MKTWTFRLLVTLATLSLASIANADTKRYLVRFKSPSAFAAATQALTSFNTPLGYNGSFAQDGKMQFMGTETRVRQTLPHLQMVIVETQNQAAIESLRNHPAIALVEEEILHPAPAPIGTHSRIQDLDNSGSASGVIPQPWGIGAVKAPEAWNITRGAGVRVMVLDTGLDQTHQGLASRVEAVQNFIGDDPIDVTDEVGHGTHVSGTILADGLDGGLVGVAPEARLLMGKACSPEGCSSLGIASGLEWAVQEHVDVVNMSLGGTMISEGEAIALRAAEAAGIVIVAASGNESKPAVSYPAAVATVLAVGAVDENMKKADFSNWGPQLAIVGPGVDVFSSVPRGTGRDPSLSVTVDGTSLPIKSMAMSGSAAAPMVTNQIVNVGLAKPENFVGVDVRGKFVLIIRGITAFKDKVANAIAAGASGAIIYNNVPGSFGGTLGPEGTQVMIPVVSIDQDAGQAISSKLASGGDLSVTFGVAATDYEVMQGTSMATPHVAGVAALVRAANHGLTPAQVRDLLKETATPLTPNEQNQLGAGLVNAEAAVNRAASMVPAMALAN